ncbi:MAG: molybdopterin-dependent oxidoreductase [Betaproteobacteria bacterium]|nr:molybdopterin-dependent oxidoreductase [Betaproteobacteria bacterium]
MAREASARRVRTGAGRRRFLIAAGAAGGGLALGVWWLSRPADRLTAPEALVASGDQHILNAWIKVDGTGKVLVQVPRQEMGQGITTALPMLVAEEMGADFASVTFEQAPVAPVYANATLFEDGVPFRPDDHGWLAELMRHAQFRFGELLGVQATGGSTGVRDAWLPMRRAGATARAMLLAAGARRFGAAVDECSAVAGTVRHVATGRWATFGDLAAEAATTPVPADVTLRQPADFVVLGRSQQRLDVRAKVDGSAQFGSDVRLPGMLYAAIAQSPTQGGRVASLDDRAARARKGVRAVLSIPATSASAAAVVVVADRYWRAKTALDAVEITWAPGASATHDTRTQRDRYLALLRSGDARVYDAAGDPEAALAAPSALVDATYFAPYLAHATMEPVNCTAVVHEDGRCEVWVGNQAPTLVKWFAARAADIPRKNVTVHTPYLGGGFGRRVEVDVVMQAVGVASRLRGTPVQLLWSREEDTRHDVYRPMAVARLRAALDSRSNLTAWVARVVSQSCTTSLTARLMPSIASGWMKDRTSVEGLYDLPYGIPNRRTEHVLADEPVPVGFWRSVGYSQNAWFAECFVDECAAAAKQDPVAFRRALLQDAPRHLQVLDTVARAASWDTPPGPGIGRGIALVASFHSIVAQVAEVEIVDAQVRVRRVTCAVDCGFAVNPDTVVAQMESGIVYGLTAALHGEISIRDGRVEQSNFTDYPMVTLGATPDIDVHIVASGADHPGGVGEPGTPPIAPAVCNALFALTGKRIRSLPIRIET